MFSRQELTKHCDTLLDKWLHNSSPMGSHLDAAMRYMALAGGKRSRPILIYMVGEVLGVPINKLDAAAVAVELLHTYSLVHDDLPCMDNSNWRRGQMSCHTKYDVATAVLVGDALQTEAFAILSCPSKNSNDSLVALNMVNCLAEAAGRSGMVLGQILDMQETDNPSFEYLNAVVKYKTGALFAACIKLASIPATNLNLTDKENLNIFADNLGLAFQIKDDILDLTVTTEKLGKTAQLDVQNQKGTFATVLGLKQAKSLMSETFTKSMHALSNLSFDTSLIKQFITDLVLIN